MQRRKSRRHQHAAHARWRAAEERAQAERDAGIPDREPVIDARQPFLLPLSHFGYRDLWIEPRVGFVAWRALDAETRELLHCAASKELLRILARETPRLMAPRD